MDRMQSPLPYPIHKQFRLLWGIITGVVLYFCSYVMWQNHVLNAFIQTTSIAHKQASSLDHFINQLFLNLQTLPIYHKSHLNCKKDFLPYLEHINIRNPKISAIAIKEKKQGLICSTLPYNKSFLLKNNSSSQAISGPIKLPTYNIPIYSIQKNTERYRIEVIISASVLENILKPSRQGRYNITLYDENKKKNILQITDSSNGSWVYNQIMLYQLPLTPKLVMAQANLHSVDGIIVQFTYPEAILFANVWYDQILLSCDILLISFFLYHLLKNLIHKRSSLEWSLKTALRKKQFYPVYQPLFNTNLNYYTGAEILLRWKDQHDAIIMPDFFIVEAERTGLIVPITLQIIKIAFKEFQDILKTNPQFHLACNISSAHFVSPTFFEHFYELMRHYSISTSQILFEITERSIFDQNNKIYLQKMNELCEKGFSLAIDDYGTGYTSFSYLQHFPFNYLKIDKLFIHAIGTKAITELFNDTIIDLAKKINLTIIAEGVETQEQVNYLVNNGIQLLQGWYFSKALSIEQLKSLLQGETK